MTDFDDWSRSKDSRTWLTLWVFRPDGKWEIRQQFKAHAISHIYFLSEPPSLGFTEQEAINAFKEYRKTGKPVTLPIKQQSFRDRLRMGWGAFCGLAIYEFVTISKDIDRKNLDCRLSANEPTGNWI